MASQGFTLRSRHWSLSSHRTVFLLLVLFAVLLRLPSFFASNEIRAWYGALTYHDEGLFLQQGMDILRGHWPYLYHWDNRPPLGWLCYAILLALSGESLPVFRFIGALYVGLTAFILYRTLADGKRRTAGLWAGFFYILFASTLQASQSVTYEHIMALPFAGMLYCIFNPRPGRWNGIGVASLFTLCCMLLTNFVFLLPAVALVFPTVHRPTFRSGPRLHKDQDSLRAFLEWGLPVGMYGALLAGMLLACYGVVYILYCMHGQGAFLIKSLINGPMAISRQVGNATWFSGLTHRLAVFNKDFIMSYVHSRHWLLIFLCGCVAARVLTANFEDPKKQDSDDQGQLRKLLVLLLFMMLVICVRGGSFIFFPYYMQQAVPLLALIMARAVTLDIRELRWCVLVIACFGIYDTARPVTSNYRHFIGAVLGDPQYGYMIYDDPLYRVANVLNKMPLKGKNILVCGNDDMLYMLTGTENPQHFLFFYFRGNRYLQRVIGFYEPPLRWTVLAARPAVIVRPRGNGCINSFLDVMKAQYVHTDNVMNMEIYRRKDIPPSSRVHLRLRPRLRSSYPPSAPHP